MISLYNYLDETKCDSDMMKWNVQVLKMKHSPCNEIEMKQQDIQIFTFPERVLALTQMKLTECSPYNKMLTYWSANSKHKSL